MDCQRRRERARARTVWLALVTVIVLLAGCGGSSVANGATPTGHIMRATGTSAEPTPSATPTSPPLHPPPYLTARAAYLLNPATGQAYLAINANAPLAMASTTKIMTAIVALTYGKLDQQITVDADAVALQNGVASVAGVRLGDRISLRDLLYALLLPSGDDAAVVIADGIAGSQDRFVRLMNLESLLLGLRSTHYVNVHGLDAAGHYTSAHDLAMVADFAMRFPIFRQVVGTTVYSLPATVTHHAYTWTTTNELFTTLPYMGATGIKTGFTGGAGACLVFSATRLPGKLIGVVLGEPNEQARFTDAVALLNWGFGIEQHEQAGSWRMAH